MILKKFYKQYLGKKLKLNKAKTIKKNKKILNKKVKTIS